MNFGEHGGLRGVGRLSQFAWIEINCEIVFLVHGGRPILRRLHRSVYICRLKFVRFHDQQTLFVFFLFFSFPCFPIIYNVFCQLRDWFRELLLVLWVLLVGTRHAGCVSGSLPGLLLVFSSSPLPLPRPNGPEKSCGTMRPPPPRESDQPKGAINDVAEA